MKNKKFMAALMAASITAGAVPSTLVFANEMNRASEISAQHETQAEDILTDENEIAVDYNLQVENRAAKAYSSEYNVKVASFTLADNAAYSADYRVSGIKSYSNNGGKYASSTLDKAFDGNTATHWETGTPNSNTHTNEVIVTFDEVEEINRIVYGARPDASQKGYATKFSIYASMSETGDDFELVGKGEATKTSGLAEFKFETTSFKRLKFVFDEAQNYWASACEFMFYKQDVISEKMADLFTNGLMNELKPEYRSLEIITALEAQVQNHALREYYMDDINLAKALLANASIADTHQIVVGEQRGAYGKGTADRYINGNAYASFESFGKYVTTGETITVYVDTDPNGVMPQLCIGQAGKGQGDWRRWVTLKPGKNVITAPANINPSALYLVNNADASQQAYAPRVRVEGGTAFPIYFHGETDPEVFFEELKAYAANIEYEDAAFANGNPAGKVFNIAEFVSENCVITTSAMGAINGLEASAKQGYNISDTMDSWEEMYAMFQSFLGLEEDAAENKHIQFPNKFVARVFKNVPLGFADHGYTGYLGGNNEERVGGFFDLMAMPIYARGNDNWCYTHEFGHIFNTKYIVHGEVTNNLFAQEYRRIKGLGGDRADWNGILKRFKGEEVTLGFWTNLAILSQLNIAYGYDAYAKASTAVRDHIDVIKGIQGGELRRLAVAYSLGLEVDLLDFFEEWNYTDVTPEMRAAVSHLPKETRKIEYLHNGAYDYAGTGFSENVAVQVTTSVNDETQETVLKFAIDAENQDDLLGYEILVDGEVIGFTRDNSFTIKDSNVSENVQYEVVAYAKDLTTAKRVSVNTFAPTLQVVEEVTLGLGETFNPLDYAAAVSYNGAALEILDVVHNVDTSQKGRYEVSYVVMDNGVTMTKTMGVTVVSAYDYLSDKPWTSVSTQWGTPRRNSNIKGRQNGQIKTYEKGFGIHANGEIVYDLGEHDYDRFEAFVGVDMTIAAQENSSIKFKVFVDGEELASTSVIKHEDNIAYVSVPVAGAKELKIVVDNGGNGNTSDHAVIVNPKLTNNNMKPSLNVAKDVVVKVGETLEDIFGEYSAQDAEDGDLTSEVSVSGDVNFRQPGKYTITYTVTDADGNTAVAERMISVVDMDDYTYVSDANWKSASCGWGSIRRDLSPSGNSIRLTDDSNQEVQFAKGLGTHATSTIVYDLTTVDAAFFSAYVGVDRAMYGTVGSVVFEVYLDGEKVANTGVITSRAAMEYLEVNLAGAKELKIVATDGGNGNGSDHAVWGDAKFHFANPENIAADRTALEAYIATLNLLDSSKYTDESWAAFAEVKANAELLLEADKVTQVALDEAVESLKVAQNALVLVGEKTDLRALLAEAEALKGNIYTADSWNALQKSIENVKEALYGMPEQAVIDAVAKALQEAMDTLELSTGKMALKSALDLAEDFTAETFSEAPMWHEFTVLKAEAENIYFAVTVDSEAALVNLSNELQEVMSSLKVWQNEQAPKVDKTLLKELVAKANALDLRIYTKASKANLQETIDRANQMLGADEASQEEVDVAASALEEVLNQLEISNGKAELKKVLDLAATKNEADYNDAYYWEMFAYCYEFYMDVYEKDHDEQQLYIAHVYFMTVIEDLEQFGRTADSMENL